ncbi:acylprotein thioesterase [Plasmopara halstedii]|uniref:palmitoyl-protein hydrolase n=1 Tax=Plasmopara halstedii TaxID=4781 RepID=A0A0P1AI26_PLAHL|nr:acylprotein thioesterase [Plasmopara halstedii]CEG40668.1 acylprotein thioesterase [Plasmopara halstedii]|eukprot:XP_024577037.1 acylprotein thioesterase [Plasmopara halstedii]
MSSSRITTDADNNLVLSPQKPTAAVIFLHGLGDTGHGWSDAMIMLAKGLPHVKFVLPTASSMPVTLNMGMHMPAWYDIKSLARVNGDDADGIDASRDRIMTIIEKEVAAGIPLSRIVLGGFSQGAALSLFSGYQTKKVLGGIISMSGYLPRYASFQVAPETANVPLLMCHGEQDQVVRFEYGKMSKEKLETAGVKNIKFHSYPKMEHSACAEELDHVTKWLEGVIPGI